MKNNEHNGFFVEDLCVFAKQGLEALNFFDKIELTHTDLKPENLLLKYPELEKATFPRRTGNPCSNYLRPMRADIKVIDFGGATFREEHHSTTISTRQYRAPEVLLESGWNQKADVFSFGCILMELYTGRLVLQTHDLREHLHMMEKVVGSFSSSDLAKASTHIKDTYLQRSDRRDGYNWFLPHLDDDTKLDRSSLNCIRRATQVLDLTSSRHREFAEFVSELLVISPRRRKSPAELLHHGYFNSNLPE